MEKYMNKGIKEVIGEVPEVGRILESFGVGCVTCSLGTCLMKDIINIHNLPRAEEVQLMARIEKAIYPNRDVKIEIIVENEKENIKKDVKLEYSKPIKELVDEHTEIKILLKNIPKICALINESHGTDYKLVLECVEFIKNYADKFHHSKEEDILFKYVDENADIIKSMMEDHKMARWFIKSVLTGVDKHNVDIITKNLTSYGELLMEHIKREDEILYPFIERSITQVQLDEINQKFNFVNLATGNDFNEKWAKFLNEINELV